MDLTFLEMRIKLQTTISDTLNGIMYQNKISPAMMEDAINSYLRELNPLVLQEYLINSQKTTDDSSDSTEVVEEQDE